MRERTPSADDNPRRAPPAPLREAASADATGSKTSSEPVEVHRGPNFSPATTASSASATSPSPCADARMVASTHNLDELTVSHPTGASGDRQQQQEKHGPAAYRSAQTAQDKRSRLSNVINNLRKKVPDSRNGDSPRKEEDDRNSVERNLETLEKYVMTVLNGVIKDEEEEDGEVGRKKEEKGKDPEKLTEEQEDEDSKGPAAKFEPSKPNESRTEAAVFSSKQPEKPEAKEPLDHRRPESGESDEEKISSESREPTDGSREENQALKVEAAEERCSSRETKPEDDSARTDTQEEERKESRSLGTIIMERLSEHQTEDKGSVEAREFVSENAELRNVCRDLLNDLLNGINQLIDGNSQATEEGRSVDGSVEESKDSRSPDLSTTSLHCSLPLDKVASVLQSCQSSELAGPQSPSSSSSSSSQGSKSPSKPTSPTVRHLCLYCDRKFLSISLRQRHTERVHQQGGGRRSERNSRRPSQNCQYCSDKCSESLESLFQHMAGSHGDKYYACVQCSTRYLTREALAGHVSEHHADRNLQIQEKTKEPSSLPCKELGNQSLRDRPDQLSPKERRSAESDHEHRAESILLKPMISMKDNFSNPGSPEFDSSFYSSVSCNIRENLLHHLDGKLQSSSSAVATTSLIVDSKLQLQQQQTYYEHTAAQIQFPIDISLTAATPVYSKDYANEEYENNSEYAQKPGKRNRSHPRRVSFEKYNFPRKYDGKEQWTCSIKDLSKFDISTQLSLRKKQQLLKERHTLSRLHQISLLSTSETTDIAQDKQDLESRSPEESKSAEEASGAKKEKLMESMVEGTEATSTRSTEFTSEFESFLRLRKWDEKTSTEAAKKQEVVYAELTGEWSRPRIYICGACATRHVTLKEMEDHKAVSHPNVWCSHFEFSGDQRELYKHLFLPGKNIPTAKAKAAMLAEKVCTKCSKNCTTLSELHRHMLECGGDQAWLLGLFGNGKKKCKWRPFGSRSRRRRQRGMKRNIQNSQTPRVNTPKEKQPTGPRVRPSDRESIQKMLANLPPKRATRKVLQDSTMRTQGRLRNVQTRTRPRMVGDNSTASRMSRNKAVLRNKLLKNAKSIQRNRCRIDNISAVIESVVRNYHPDRTADDDEDAVDGNVDGDTKEKSIDELNAELVNEKSNRTKVGRGPRVLGKRRNVRTKDGATRGLEQPRKGSLKARARGMLKNSLEPKAEGSGESSKAPKGIRVSPKSVEKEAEVVGPEASPVEAKSPNFLSKNKPSAQTTPKRKRPVDPVASLNASIKAKSQLRTQDGKFAKNPNKDPFSPVKSSEDKSPVFGRQLSKERINEISPETSVTRSKLRTVSRNRNNDQPPKRTTRLSSDSDKMPTLEPVVQIPADNEDYTEATANDLPILSPVALSSSLEKASRGKNLKLGARKTTEGEGTEAGEAVQAEERDQKQRGRRAKSDLRNSEKNKAEGGRVKEKPKRKSAPARMLSVEEKRTVKNIEEASLKRETKQKREDGARTLDTRSNSKTRTLDEEPIKLENVPFEVKKLIGADNKDDLMNKLVLTSLTTTSKRCLRQPMSRVKFGQTKCKIRKDTELEKKADSGSMSDASTKKEKFEARRKSLRNTERKFERSRKEEKFDRAGKICEAVNEVKAAVRGRRSSSLSNDSKSTMNTGQVSPSEESTVQNSDRRQTRGSLMNSSEEQNEVGEASQRKIASTGKRRGRVRRTSVEVSEKKNVEADKNSTEAGQNETKLSEESIVKDKQKDEDGIKEPLKCPDVSETNKINGNRLQLETSNSVDSGKENTLETPAPVQKLKVGRPRKSWGVKRERTSKRSLNNVIGILTEGMNIPAEAQQSAPLAPQPAVEIANAEEISGSSVQQPGDDSKPVNEDKSEKDSQITESAGTPVENTEEESRQPEASETSEEDASVEDRKEDSLENSKPENAKEQSPTDIILDLSRRKQKGKGSFLEKIVSKIAKQKDALLEGEVGSLLDTAADELTSILDEVGPALSEIAENSVEKNTRTEAEQKAQESDEHSTSRNLENKDTKVEGEETALETSVTLKQSEEEKENTEENIDKEASVEKEPSDDELRPEEKNTESSPDTNKEEINSKEIEPQITPEEECKAEILKEDPNKDTKVSLNPEESEKSSASDHQGSNEKVSKTHKHRRPRGRKPAAKNKTVDLINDSEESEEEDKVELQNKSKIVKSVFGRVFGGEKVNEKVKEPSQKSEEGSDLSRTNFVSTVEATSEARSEDKNLKKHSVTPSVPSTTRKKPGRKPKDSSSSDKSIQEFPSSYFVPVPPSKSRQCKKIAEERIFRSFFLGIEQKKTNYGLRNQSKSDSSIKDSDYGSFSNDEDFCKMVSLEDAEPKSRDSKAEDEAMSSEDLSKEICNDTESSRKELAEDSSGKQEVGASQLNPEYEDAFLENQKESSICDPEISCTEPSPVSNETQLLTVQNVSEEKKNQEAVSEEAKIKRKSKKRSLEGNSPKKSKRKSVEPVDNSEENLIPDELDLADIMELIDKSKQVPSTKDNFEDDLPAEERVQCGKRKTISEDRVLKDSDSEMIQDTRVAEESTEIAKKRKVDSEENAADKKDETEIETNSIEDPKDEGDGSLLLNISGKRKSYVSSTDHCQIPESPVKSSSKRRSIHDEKSGEPFKEDALSRLEPVEATEPAEITPEEQTESGSVINDVEECQSSVNETLDIAERSEEKPALENTDLIKNLPEANPTEPVKPPVTVKVLKKRGRKKKNPVDVQAEVINQENSQVEPVNVDQVPRRSLRTSRFNEEPEEQNKASNDAVKSQTASPILEQFKVPEVTEVLQLTKKRTYKRRSTTDEHLDGQNGSPSIESETKYSEVKSLNEKEEQPSVRQKDFLESKQRSSRGSHQLGLERSSSSGSIDLAQTNKRRSSKRKQLSSEDLSGQGNLNLRAESVENLSETSCTSESSYFRKKRFTKRKKEFQEDAQTDTSVTDSESMDTEKPADRRQSLRRRAKENISFEYSAFDLVDYFGIPMDMEEDSPQEDAVENSVSQEPDSTTEELVQETTANISNQEPEEVNTEEKSTEETGKSEIEEEDDSKEKADKLEELPQSQDDFQAPKKRAAGNYVVVHKKTGEILIVEKRKKLTKEAARFFCDVCATSFTRKSSLKKHNQSQSHLVQVAKFRKDRTLAECKESLEDTSSIGQNEASSDENRSTTDEVKKDEKESFLDSLYDQTDLKSVEDESSSYTGPADQEFLMDSHQRILEDELLDEEICKITENMSHDEYVLTDHVSPGPESTSTPVKVEAKKTTEEVGKKKKHERKKEKAKKKGLSNEQVTLDVSDSSVMNLLDPSVSKLSDSDSEYSFLLANSLACTLNKFREKYSQNSGGTEESQDGKDSTKLKDLEQERTGHAESNLDTRAEDSNGKENHPTERLTLKLTINKRSLENFKEQDAPLDRSDAPAEEDQEKPENPLDSFGDPIKGIDQLEPEIDQLNLDMYLGSSKQVENRRNTEDIEDFDAFKVQSLGEDLAERQSSMERQNEPAKETRHGRSRKGKGRKHQEEIESSDDARGTSKPRDDQSMRISEGTNSQKSTDNSKTLEYNDENPELLLYDSGIKVDNVTSPSKVEAKNEEESEDQDTRRIQQELDSRHSTEEQQISQENTDSKNKNGSFNSLDEDEDSSSSSLADKPLSQLLLRTNLKVDTGKKLLIDSDDELRPEKNAEDSPDNEECNDKVSNSEQTEPHISSEEECEAEIPKIETEDTKTLENEAPSSKESDEDDNQKVSKSHKNSGKEGHRRSKGKKAPARSKIAALTSDSEGSEDEDKTEPQNKSKIVKSVFGRVFGGEKADKVKEVLNDWVSKSEDDSDASRSDFRSATPNELNAEEISEARSGDKRHLVASVVKKKPGRKPKDSSSIDRTKEKNPSSENRENRHSKSRNSSGNRKKPEEEASDYYFLVLPPNKSRHSKKIAEERISRAFDGVRMFEEFLGGDQKEGNYGLRSQSKPDLTIKDSGYGSFNYDEDSSKMVCSEEPPEEEKLLKRRKSLSSRTSKNKADGDDWKDLVMEMRSLKGSKEPTDEEDNSVKDLPEQEPLSADLKSRSCSSLAPSSVRNRSPSMDRNSQSTRDSDVDEEDEDIGRGRISPLFVRETPGSSIENSSNSENEEEDENVPGNESTVRKRSSSEFSGEKIVIRSPSSTHKGEVVTIAPTDAIEDNALDVPQEIETAKPRQGKVLNFDEELFVECCSRLKATTENELRGAKKIKLDHNEGYHRKDDQQQGLRGPRDRWRDVESQNSLGSLLESVNQLLGEEMYSTRERDYPKRGGRNLRSEHSSRSASPDMSRADNLGYEDSLDVAFEHNNKLRDKIQQRMRESESLIASTFGKSSNDSAHRSKSNEQDLRNSYSHLQEQGQVSGLSNRSYSDAVHIRNLQEQQNAAKMHLDSGFKNKMNSSLGGLLDKALSNLLHSNGKHDHNGSTPMKVLAELACARAPTSTTGLPISQEVVQPAKTLPSKESIPDPCPVTVPKDVQKKPRNPIKELFERKKEMNERKQQEKSKTEAALRELNVHRQRKTKKMKKHQDFPLIRRGEHVGGLVERKKRRDGFERKEEFVSDRIKDVYDFDEEESQIEPNLGSVMSYRSRPGYEVSCLRTKEVDVAGLMSKAIGDSLENGKTGDALSSRLESMIDRKFKELEKFAPKTKGALKSFQSEDQRQITGPMDEFVERKQLKSKRPVESLKHSKLKKRNKNPKKKTRNAWYENDSSDEYRTTAVKPEDIGVGISKSQRTCSKGKQNIFAELYTSSESEFEHEGVNYESKKQRRAKKGAKKVAESEDPKRDQELVNKYSSENEEHWRDQDLKDDAKHESDHKKSESEMSDHPLVIDERKEGDEQRNSDEETETQYERNYEMDDLYREDSSVVDSDVEDSVTEAVVPDESGLKSSDSLQEKINGKENSIRDELIPLEEALDMLDQADNEASEANYNNVNSLEDADPVITTETFNPVEESAEKSPSIPEEQEQEEEPDNDLLSLPEKLSSNEKPQKESDNLPLHVFLSRKVQESKKRKEQQLKKMQEEQERILMDFQPTRRQRKCAIGKQGLLAEISSSDEEVSPRDRRSNDKSDHDKPRKQKRESKEKRKERYIEKKHEQMIAKEQKAIEEEILREVGKKKDSLAQNTQKSDLSDSEKPESMDDKIDQEISQKKKHQAKERQKKPSKVDEDNAKHSTEGLDDPEGNCNRSVLGESNHEDENNQESPVKQKRHSKSATKPKKTSKGDAKVTSRKTKNGNSERSRNRTDSKGSRDKERRSSNGKHDSDDEELKTTKSWNKVEEGVGVAIGRRKRAAANQLYYWSSSSDEEEMLEVVPVVEEEEDDRQEQHGWIVGDSHKRMITMLAMEKQLKEKRRRSEDEFEPGRAKSKKHRNSTS